MFSAAARFLRLGTSTLMGNIFCCLHQKLMQLYSNVFDSPLPHNVELICLIIQLLVFYL